MKHTPTPWKARDYANKDGDFWIDCDSWRNPKTSSCRGGTLATVHKNGAGEGDAEANAVHIVRCVNAWDNADALRARLAELEPKP